MYLYLYLYMDMDRYRYRYISMYVCMYIYLSIFDSSSPGCKVAGVEPCAWCPGPARRRGASGQRKPRKQRDEGSGLAFGSYGLQSSGNFIMRSA